MDIRISLSVIQNLQAVEKQIRHCLQRSSVKRDCPLKRCAEGYLNTGVKALVASTLSIKPVMGSEKGAIIQLGQAIGIKKGLAKMAAAVAADAVHPEEKTLMITHCNCLERAEAVKNMVLQKISCRDVVIMDTRGVSSMYANDGGVIVTL